MQSRLVTADWVLMYSAWESGFPGGREFSHVTHSKTENSELVIILKIEHRVAHDYHTSFISVIYIYLSFKTVSVYSNRSTYSQHLNKLFPSLASLASSKFHQPVVLPPFSRTGIGMFSFSKTKVSTCERLEV